MEATTTIIALIFVVFGVLQIILFFKLWGMTNDVKEIKSSMAPQRNDIMREILKGNPNISSILFDAIYKSMHKAYCNSSSANAYKDVVDEYKPMYKKAGVDLPVAFTKIGCDADWMSFTSCEEQNT